MAKFQNISLLKKMIDDGYVADITHASAPELHLYCYTDKCEQEHKWNSVTMVCNGLICDNEYNIIAVPFSKVFNIEDYKKTSQIPLKLDYTAYDDIDGTLGILFWYNDNPYICTRNSFDSEQALHATDMLYNKYINYIGALDRTKTYLFEIVYPENTHIINYEEFDDLILVGIVDNETCKEEDIYESPVAEYFNLPERYSTDDLLTIREDEFIHHDNRKGFIIRFSNGFKINMQYDSYTKADRLLHRLSEKNMFKYIYEGKTDDLLKEIEILDERHKLIVDSFCEKMYNEFTNLALFINSTYGSVIRLFEGLPVNEENDAKLFKEFEQYDFADILKSIYQKESYINLLWEYIKKIHKY